MKIGIADTMFAVTDMSSFAKQAIDDSEEDIKIERYTVPGIKDLPVACKKLIEENNCDICLALGMPGGEKIDKQCAHEASTGIINTQLKTNKHILEVFVHLDEADNNNRLHEMTKVRTYKHTMNAIALLKGKTELQKHAGTGQRQGHKSVGRIK